MLGLELTDQSRSMPGCLRYQRVTGERFNPAQSQRTAARFHERAGTLNDACV